MNAATYVFESDILTQVCGVYLITSLCVCVCVVVMSALLQFVIDNTEGDKTPIPELLSNLVS